MAIKRKGYVNFIVSPDKLDVLFLKKINGIWKITEHQEFNDSLITKDNLNIDLIKQAITHLNIKNTEVGISLNTPFFFTNVIKVPNIEGNIKNTLGIKIQTEFPLPIEKYLWSFQEIPSSDSQRTFLVFFYRRNFLEEINKAFSINGILPVVIEPSILSALRYLKEKFTLEIEKTYFMIILYSSVLTGFIYENGIIKNTFSESISENINIQQSLEKFIQFTLQKFSVERIKREIGGVIFINDKQIRLNSDFEVMYLQDILKMTPNSIIGIGLNERVLRAPVSGNEILLNTINPAKEFLHLKISNYLNFWSSLVFGAGIISILALSGYIMDLSITNKNLRIDAVSSNADVSKYENDLKEILFLSKKIDISNNIPYDVFVKINNLNKFMQIKNATIRNKVLTIIGTINIKNQGKLSESLSDIGTNIKTKEIKSLKDEDEIEIEVSLDFK